MGRLSEGERVVVAPVRRIHHEHDFPGRQKRRSGEGVEPRDFERSARPTRARLRSPAHTGGKSSAGTLIGCTDDVTTLPTPSSSLTVKPSVVGASRAASRSSGR
jgi:hypothetical protein